MTFVQIILALVKPVLSRVLVALGLSVVTITGVDIVLSEVKGWLVQSVQGLPANAAMLAGLAGAGEALGMVLGAVSFAGTMWAIQSATAIYGKGQG